MHIQLESADQHTIQAYKEDAIQVLSVWYGRSVILSPKEIITDLAVTRMSQLDQNLLNRLTDTSPELLLIGHQELGVFPPAEILAELTQKAIGLECMSLGAACRTFNVLLNEHREVTALFLFS